MSGQVDGHCGSCGLSGGLVGNVKELLAANTATNNSIHALQETASHSVRHIKYLQEWNQDRANDEVGFADGGI